MFPKFDSNDFAKWGRIVGIALFAAAFLLPGVHLGQNSYSGLECAWETLCFTATFFATLSRHERSEGWSLFMMVSGWITPLVLFGLVAWSGKIKRGVAMILPFFLLAPWLVFALTDGAESIRPSFGHYIWTVGCLLIFTPEYAAIIASLKKVKNTGTERN